MEALELSINFQIPNKSTVMIQALLALEELKSRFGEGVVERAMEAYALLNEIRECKIHYEKE